MKQEKCKRGELKDTIITIRITNRMKKFMEKNKYSPSKVMIEALTLLGFR